MYRKVSFFTLYIIYIYIFEELTTAADVKTYECLVPRSNVIIKIPDDHYHRLTAGETVNRYSNVSYSCPRYHILEGSQKNYCDGEWKNEHPKCIRTCPPILGHTIDAICHYQEETISCEDHVKFGTTARISCAFMYKIPSDRLVHQDLRCENDGEWNHPLFRCEQICGTVDTNFPFSVKSELTEPRKVPWHVGIYSKLNSDKYEQICGGTLIHSKIVISAAHCFWDPSTSAQNDKSQFSVAVGKLYRDYYASNETLEIQKSNLSKIDIPVTFRGADYDYLSDIAVLTLEDHVQYKNHIRPACLTWKQYGDIPSNVSGVIAGWGETETGPHSPDLRSVELLSIDRNTCTTKKIGRNNNIARDKFCVDSSTGKNICRGDSGGGFMVPENVGSAIYIHLWGVFSNAVTSKIDGDIQCDSNLIPTLTSVQNYGPLINDAILKAYPVGTQELITLNKNETTPSCLVPTQNLILTDTKSNREVLPGIVVPRFTSVNYSCPIKYVLKGDTTNVCDVHWKNPHPKCLKMCQPIQGHTLEAFCEYNGQEVDCKKYAKPGTTARINCAILYRKPGDNSAYQNLNCQENGKWNYEPFKCEQLCGTLDTNIAFSVNSKITEPIKVPWHVGIYSKRNGDKYEHICGGTLIHSKIVISAAHCFWDPSTSAQIDKSQFIVAVGKMYRDYYSSNETLEVQKSNLSKINIPVTFRGPHHDYANDIAVLTLEDHINYKSYIRPACLSWKSENDRYIESNHTGLVAGWGITNTGTYSPDLRSVELLSIDSNTCKTKKIRKSDSIAGDKFCVETSSGKNVCPGDSGGGYVVSETIGSAIYYHLWGVVSNGIMSVRTSTFECNSNFITTFTNVQFYRQLINDAILNAYKIV